LFRHLRLDCGTNFGVPIIPSGAPIMAAMRTLAYIAIHQGPLAGAVRQQEGST
jgi:hypothetical protein